MRRCVADHLRGLRWTFVYRSFCEAATYRSHNEHRWGRIGGSTDAKCGTLLGDTLSEITDGKIRMGDNCLDSDTGVSDEDHRE